MHRRPRAAPRATTCDTASGQCSECGGTDGGTDGGTGVSCSWNTCTGAGEVCDLVNGSVCVQQGTCNSANAQPDTCAWAQYCAGDNKCYEPAKATCANFTPPGGATPTFYTSGDTGPIIYYVDDLAPDDAAFCTVGSNAFTLHHQRLPLATWPWPSSKSALSGFWYVDDRRLEESTPPPILRADSGYVVSGANATMKVTLLLETVTANLSAGFYFTGGNEFCATGTAPTREPRPER